MKNQNSNEDILLVDYTDEWDKKFQTEKLIWTDILNDNLITIQHVGSTSIRGIKAKPIIDILMFFLLNYQNCHTLLRVKMGFLDEDIFRNT